MIILANVDLPLPDSPTIAKHCPFFTEKETSSKALTVNDFVFKKPVCFV
jgi:hypothetical protein